MTTFAYHSTFYLFYNSQPWIVPVRQVRDLQVNDLVLTLQIMFWHKHLVSKKKRGESIVVSFGRFPFCS